MTHFSILNVAPFYLEAEALFKEKKFVDAFKSYKQSIDNYENADDIYYFTPDEPYTITERGITKEYPSINDCVYESKRKMRIIARKWKSRKK